MFRVHPPLPYISSHLNNATTSHHPFLFPSPPFSFSFWIKMLTHFPINCFFSLLSSWKVRFRLLSFSALHCVSVTSASASACIVTNVLHLYIVTADFRSAREKRITFPNYAVWQAPHSTTYAMPIRWWRVSNYFPLIRLTFSIYLIFVPILPRHTPAVVTALHRIISFLCTFYLIFYSTFVQLVILFPVVL